jgi:hypothetical protein
MIQLAQAANSIRSVFFKTLTESRFVRESCDSQRRRRSKMTGAKRTEAEYLKTHPRSTSTEKCTHEDESEISNVCEDYNWRKYV